MANHEQDQTPAGSEARDSEDEGTFRWPTTGLPKIFGQQSAEEEEAAEQPDSGSGGTPPAGQAEDRQHPLRAAPPPYRASFNRAAYSHLLVPSPAPDAGEAGAGEQPSWSPAPPPGTEQREAPPAAEAFQPAEAEASAEEAETAEPLEKRIRVEGVKTGRITALDLPSQIQQAVAAGIITDAEAATLREYDRKVMDLINVDDFAPHELGTQAEPVPQQAAVRSSAQVA